MTAMTYRRRETTCEAHTQVWRCDECHCVHLCVEQTLLTFTPEEFARFAEEVGECYCVQDAAARGSLMTFCGDGVSQFAMLYCAHSQTLLSLSDGLT